MADFVVRINRREGSVEVSGDDRDWVEQTIASLAYIYKDLPVDIADAPKRVADSEVNLPKSAEQRSARKPSAAKRPEINNELKARLTRQVTAKLDAFIGERNKAFDASLPAQAIIIAIFLEDELGLTGIDKNDLFTVYRELGKPSGNTDAQLRNAYARNHYFSNIQAGKYMPSSSGDTFARFGSKNA